MSLDQTPAESADELAARLGEAIADLPEYEAFEAAKRDVEESEELQAQIAEFEQRREEFSLARQSGEATEADLAELKRAQRELHSQPAMAAYLDAQAELQDRLEALNEAVSAPLDVDFGGEAGGCCQD